MIRSAIFVGVLAAIPATVSAQGVEFDGTVTIGYSANSIDGLPGTDLNLNGFSFDADGDLRFSEEFSVGLGIGMSTGDLEISGAPISPSVDLMSLSVAPRYDFTSGAYAGLYYHMNDLDIAIIGPITVGIDIESYGLFGGFEFAQGHVEAFYGMSDIGETFGLDLDITDYGLSGAYQVMPELDVFGSVIRSDISIATVDLDVTNYSLGAAYDIGNGIEIYGAAGAANLDLSAIGAPSDITASGLTLGGSYDLGQSGGSLPLVLSAEFSRTNLDLSALGAVTDPTINRFALGVTIPIGNGSGDALNSNTRTARGDFRSAIVSVLQSF